MFKSYQQRTDEKQDAVAEADREDVEEEQQEVDVEAEQNSPEQDRTLTEAYRLSLLSQYPNHI